MTKQEIGILVEDIIQIRDLLRNDSNYSWREVDRLADIINLVDHNINLLSDD